MKIIEKIKRAFPIAKRLLRERLAADLTYLLSDKTMRRNVFKRKNYQKRVLMVSILAAFNKVRPKYHTCLYEIYEVGRIFDQLGYAVDVTTDDNVRVDLTKYDVIYDGRKIQAEVWRKNIPAKTIRFSPGAHPIFCYEATVQKNIAIKSEKSIWLTTSSRYLNASLLTYYVDYFADHVIVYGNQYVLDNYLKYDSRKERYSLLPAFYFDCHQPDLEHKDFDKVRHSMCWFGSLGLIHKGLDVAIDIALAHPEITLHICGATKREKEFWNYYGPLIKDKPNIIDHGFINIESQEFVDIMSQCAFMINPSISEGGAAAVLNVVANGGLIPICSLATGLDFPSDDSYIIDDISKDAFERVLLEAMSQSEATLRQQSIAVCEYVRKNYAFEAFQRNMYNIIKSCVEE